MVQDKVKPVNLTSFPDCNPAAPSLRVRKVFVLNDVGCNENLLQLNRI